MINAGSLNLRKKLKLQPLGVFLFFRDCLTGLDQNIFLLISRLQIMRKAILRKRTLASKALHFRSHLRHQIKQFIIRLYPLFARRNRYCRDRLYQNRRIKCRLSPDRCPSIIAICLVSSAILANSAAFFLLRKAFSSAPFRSSLMSSSVKPACFNAAI